MCLQEKLSRSVPNALFWKRLTRLSAICILGLSFWSLCQLSVSATTDPNQDTSIDAAPQLTVEITAEAEARQLADHTNNPKKGKNNSYVAVAPFTSQDLLPSTCAGLRQEAESGSLSGAFVVGDDPVASGGHYIHAPTGSGNYYNGPNPQQKADYCFNVPITGSYNIRVGTYAEDSLSDSFYAQVDGQPSASYLWDIYPVAKYTTDYVNDRFLADPVEIQLSPGPHTFTVYVREDGARLDTIELQLALPDASPAPVCGGLSQEAEDGVLTGDFMIGNDPLASAGKFIHVPEGTGDYWYGPNVRQLAKYCFDVTEQGTYRLDGNVYGSDLLSDSFYVRVDNKPATAYLWDVLLNTSYLTDSLSNRYLADPVSLKLPVGPHTVTVYLREDGTRLDKLQLVKTGTYSEPAVPPLTAKPISGTIHVVDSSLVEELDFSQIYLSLLDAATRGQRYRQHVQVDRLGHFQFEEMEPGEYIVRIELPETYTTAVNELAVTATLDVAVEIAFDITMKIEKVYLPIVKR